MEEKKISEKIDETYDFIQQVKEGNVKIKKLRIPRKAKVGKLKRKKGYIGILRVDENGTLRGEKVKVEDSTFTLKDGTNHATDSGEILYWNGKFPVFIQPTWSINPTDLRKEKPKNETYGQKYIQARMLKAVITNKKKAGNMVIWIVVAIAAVIGYSVISKGGI